MDLTHHSVQERNGCLTLAPFFLEFFIFNIDVSLFLFQRLISPFQVASLVVRDIYCPSKNNFKLPFER